MKLVAKALLSMSVLAVAALPAFSQAVISAKSGVINYVLGRVLVNDQEVRNTATKATELKEGAVLRTEEGRAEVLLTMGSVLRVGDAASLVMVTNRLIDTRVDLVKGTHILEVADVQKDNNLTIIMKDATVVITKKGLYRFDVDQAKIKVFEGVLGVTRNGQSTLVGAGKAMDTNTASVEKFDREATDAMDRWAKKRGELLAMANTSSAKQVHDYGCAPYSASTNYAAVNTNPNDPCNQPTCGSWRYNPWFGTYTYIPCGGNIYSPYGYRYWSPYNVMRAYYVPRVMPAPSLGGGGFGANQGSYAGIDQTQSGYSGAMSTASSPSVSSATAAPSSSTSTASSAGTAASGAGASGGHGK